MSGYDDLERQLAGQRRATKGAPAAARTCAAPAAEADQTSPASMIGAQLRGGARRSPRSRSSQLGRHKRAAAACRPRPRAVASHGTQGRRVPHNSRPRELSYINAALHALRSPEDPALRSFGAEARTPAGAGDQRGSAQRHRCSPSWACSVGRATAADRLPPRASTRHGHLLVGPGSLDGVYVRYIRLARVDNGVCYDIVPGRQESARPPPPGVASWHRCYSEQMRRPTQPARGRARVACEPRPSASEPELFAQTRSEPGEATASTKACSSWSSGPAAGAAGGGDEPGRCSSSTACSAADRARRSRRRARPASPPSRSSYPASGRGKHRIPPLTLNTDVVGNVFAVSVPRANGGHFPPTMVCAASAQGTVIKTVTMPMPR